MFARHYFVLLTIIALTFSCSVLSAQETHPPVPQDKLNIISIQELAQFVQNKKAVIFDQRNAINYGRGHIPGAIYLAYENQKPVKAYLHKLPQDKNVPIIFYSREATAWKSHKVAVIALNAGYRNVYWFRNGYTQWVETGMPVEK